MKKVISALMILTMSLGVGIAAGKGGKGSTEVLSVIRLTDFDKSVTFEIMPASDASDLQKRIVIETRVMAQALRAATKEWDSTVANKKVPLPVKVVPRTLRVLNTHTDSKKADEALKKAEERYSKEEKAAKSEAPKKLTDAEKTEQANAMEIFKTELDKLATAEESAEKQRVQQTPK